MWGHSVRIAGSADLEWLGFSQGSQTRLGLNYSRCFAARASPGGRIGDLHAVVSIAKMNLLLHLALDLLAKDRE